MQTITFNAGIAYAEYQQRKAAYIMAAIVAFVMSSYFVVGYLAGNLLFWTWDISQTMNGAVGVGICAVMTSYQFILYSQGDVKGGKKATILAVCVAVGFSLLSEVGQGMERDHVRMETKSQQSPTYQALITQVGNTGTTSHPYSAELQTAQMKLARCQQKVSAGEWSDCIESTARLNSVKEMISDYYQQNKQHTVTLANTAKSFEKDESNYHPLVNLIKGIFSATGVVASFILSLVLISFFEYAFHYLGRQLAEARAVLLSNGYDVTRRNRKTPKALQRIKENNHPAPLDNTWNDELSKSGLDSPDDDVLNQSANAEQVRRIVDRAQSVSDTPEKVSEKVSTDRARTVPDTFQREADGLYSEWSLMVRSGEIKPTVRPARQLIAKTLCGQTRDKTVTPAHIDIVINNWFEKAESDGFIIRNQNGGVGKPKYLLSQKYTKKILGTEDEQFNMQLV